MKKFAWMKFFIFLFSIAFLLVFLWFCMLWITSTMDFFKLRFSMDNDWWTHLVVNKENKFELYLLATNTFIWMPAQIMTAIGVIIFAGWNISVLKREARKRDSFELKSDFNTCLSQLTELIQGNNRSKYSKEVAEKFLSCIGIRSQVLVQNQKVLNIQTDTISGNLPTAKFFSENYHYIMSLTTNTEINCRMYENAVVGSKIVEIMKFSDDIDIDYVRSQVYYRIASNSQLGLDDPSFLYLEYFNSYRMFESEGLYELLDFFIYCCERYNRSHLYTDAGVVIFDLFKCLREDHYLDLKLAHERFITVSFESDDRVILAYKNKKMECSVYFQSEDLKERFYSLDVERMASVIKTLFFDGYFFCGRIIFSKDNYCILNDYF